MPLGDSADWKVVCYPLYDDCAKWRWNQDQADYHMKQTRLILSRNWRPCWLSYDNEDKAALRTIISRVFVFAWNQDQVDYHFTITRRTPGWLSHENSEPTDYRAKTETRLIFTLRLPRKNGDKADSCATMETWLISSQKPRFNWLLILTWKWRPNLLPRKIETRSIITFHLLHGNEDKADTRMKTETRMSLAWKRRQGWLSLYD